MTKKFRLYGCFIWLFTILNLVTGIINLVNSSHTMEGWQVCSYSSILLLITMIGVGVGLLIFKQDYDCCVNKDY